MQHWVERTRSSASWERENIVFIALHFPCLLDANAAAVDLTLIKRMRLLSIG